MQDEVNQEDSEQNEVDGMKKGADSTGEVKYIIIFNYAGLPRVVAATWPYIFLYSYERSLCGCCCRV